MNDTDKLMAMLKATEQHAERGWNEAHEQEARAEAAEKRILELQSERDQLASENAAHKDGIGFFSYDSSGCYEEHDTAEKAAAYAEDSISEYRDNAPDGWSDEVGSVVWGVILQRATMVNERPVTKDDAVSPGIETWCDFALLPSIETPATDAWQREQMAKGVDMVIAYHRERAEELHHVDRDNARRHSMAVLDASDVAAKLRNGEAV